MRIGELADAAGVNPKTIRFYEQTGLLPEPRRTPSGYREYDDADEERLLFIKTAQRLGLTLADIREILAFRDRGERPCDYVLGVLDRQVADLDRRIDELVNLRSDMMALKAQADRLSRDDTCYCGVIEHGIVAPRSRQRPQRSVPS
ncbi:MAG: heavy metal-responsive transcriptional regulator [Actinomycetota bacterium]|jgi:DNA-binding transcriptional MerR regulator|nr:heavy metal-responsive transcriptional regulator [Actinomycetota bacterium]